MERGGGDLGGYRNLIHCGTGRFCRAAFASLTFVRKDLLDGIVDGRLDGVWILVVKWFSGAVTAELGTLKSC